MIDISSDGNISNEEREDMYRQIVEYSFETTVIHAGQRVLYINQAGADFIGATKEELIGSNVIEIFPVEEREHIIRRAERVAESNQAGELIETVIFKADGSLAEVELYCHPATFGDKPAIQSIMRDITDRKEAERNLRKAKMEVATPIVPVSEGISVVPFVGSIDGDRAAHLLELIPKKVQGQQLRYLILDFSGIYSIDATVINFMYSINSTLKLLGISPVCTGLRPELARRAVETCEEITSLWTMATVKQALTRLTN